MPALPEAPPIVRSIPAPAASTGVACRVCGVDDGDERVQRDLHHRCIDGALKAAKQRTRPARRRAPVEPEVELDAPGPEIPHEDLVARLAADRASRRVSVPPAARRRGPRPKMNQDDDQGDVATVIYGDHLETPTDVGVSAGDLSTVGLGDA